jgi:hypothetical protein
MASQVEARRPAPVEQVDLGRVTNAEERRLKRDGVVDAEPADRLLGDWHDQFMMSHGRAAVS